MGRRLVGHWKTRGGHLSNLALKRKRSVKRGVRAHGRLTGKKRDLRKGKRAMAIHFLEKVHYGLRGLTVEKFYAYPNRICIGVPGQKATSFEKKGRRMCPCIVVPARTFHAGGLTEGLRMWVKPLQEKASIIVINKDRKKKLESNLRKLGIVHEGR